MEVKLGIDGLNKNLGNIFPGLSVILEVSPGKIRDHIKNDFISRNLKNGGSAVVLLSRESPVEFLDDLRSKGVDTQRCIEDDRLLIIDWFTHKRKRVLGIEENAGVIRSSRDILNVSISINKALKKISNRHPRVAYVDVVTEAINLFGWEKTKDYVQDIVEKFKENDFITLYPQDEEVERTRSSTIYPCSDGIISVFKKDKKTKLQFESMNSELTDIDSLDLVVDHDRVRIKKEEDGVDVLSDKNPLKNISRKIFGRSNKKKEGNEDTLGDEKGLTNGKVNGRTNGLTNGKTNGKVNGRTNGLTNGKTNGKINGLVDGQEEGDSNGLFAWDESFKDSKEPFFGSESLSGDDGLVDRLVGMDGEEDIYSDYIKGEEENSLPAEDGLINGLVGGAVPIEDGVIRDTFAPQGLDFGDGSRLPPRVMPPSWFKKGLGTVVIMIFLLTIPIMLNILYIPVEVDVEIDGDFDDWHAIKTYYDRENVDLLDESLDIREYKLKESDGYLNLYMRANGTIFETDEGVHSVRFFIDIEDYGYEIGNIQADYLLEVYGWEENIEGTTLHKFNESRSSDDWNGFSRAGGGQANVVDDELEARFWIGNIPVNSEPSMMVHSMSPNGWDMTEGKVWEDLDSLTANTDLFGPKVVNSGELEPLFKFEAFSISEEAVMESLVLDYNEHSSESILNVEVHEVDNYTGHEFIGEPVARYEGFEKNSTLPIHLQLNTTPREFIVAAEIQENASSMDPIGIRLKEVICNDGLSTISPPIMENKYINEVPSEPQIDGAFAFWDEYEHEEDPLDDLSPHEAWNPNIDIRKHSLYSNEKTFFNVDVEGNMMGGADIPYHRSRPPELKDSDGDGIPDIYDPYPNDFTNDGTPDSEMVTEDGLPDVDGDGVADWAYGSDKWLNTTIPEDPEIPQRYWGEEVSRYIGPVDVPVKTGEDHLRVFIDSDPDIGYSAPWLDMRADHMINISGRNMEITSAHISEYDGSGGDWDWNVLDDVEAAINRTSLETVYDLTELGIEDYEITYVMTDWENNMDTAVPSLDRDYYDNHGMTLTSTNTDFNFYLRDNDKLLSDKGTDQMVVTLEKDDALNTHTWQSPQLAGDLNITSDIDVRLDLDPKSSGVNHPGLRITLYSNGDVIGSLEEEGITGSGTRTFSIEPQINIVQAGDNLGLETELLGRGGVEMDILYNSPDGSSRLSIPSEDVIDVESVKLFNETGEEDDVFEGEDEVDVRSVVNHKFKSETIEDVTIDVYYPNGTKMISGKSMEIFDEDTSDPSYWNEYNYSFVLDEFTPGGTYDVMVSANDVQGNLDTETATFTVPDTPGVSAYPDNMETTDPGTDANHEVIVENIGEIDDTYQLSVSSSSKNWYTELLHDGETVAVDENGDGTWDWIDDSWDSTGDGYPDVSLKSLESKEFTLLKSVPEGAEGEVDYTKLYADSYEFDISDFAELTTQTPIPEELKTLYLKENFEMDTFSGDNLNEITIGTDDKYTWVQEPTMADTFELIDYSNVLLFIEPETHPRYMPDVTVALRESGETIGTHTINDIDQTGWYEFAIKTDHTIDTGNSIEVSVSTGDRPVTVLCGSEDYDSRVEVYTDTYVRVDGINTYNETDETSEFEAGETVETHAVVSDPLGSYDIDGAAITVIDPDGNIVVDEEVMEHHDTDPNDPSLWNEYVHSLELPSDTPVGEYSIQVTGIESNGVSSSQSSSFSVPSNVTVDPDQNDTAKAGTNITYDFTIKNDGAGLDAYSLNLGSNQGWNVSLYDSDGTWIGTDTSGNGEWDDINPDYDTNDDGAPDTGFMTPGEEMDVTMEIEIPANAENGTVETTTLLATSHFDSSTTDSAEAVTTISEFSDIFLPVLSTIGLFVGMFVYRRKKEKDNHIGDNESDSPNVYHNEDRPTERYRGESIG